ncbi:relaxase/mobilization nuclease domain-containing protein [Acinetobacter lwoffii]|uniref:relaxase/mobilization nuclease domain-containing protein n=1 Tax=Acinetobacter lwoffii TaxID=28090 RepID=UPI001FB3553D|nr:relaxase/mobilization nuclease domain-containing protein [Acinetobacter lwoffii]MCJ0929364.1 relaxase/mobilization nuclease domain-containing protein [Acinetobacter lwoffii]
MIIKFLPVGTGDPKLAVSYLIGELDHNGDRRADVEILAGDPFTFSALAESVSFKYCYTSVVIAWSPKDLVTDEHISEVVSEFQQHIGAGLELDQYHMTVVMHSEEDGSRHLHILIPRVELRTGKSFNVAPPGHRHYFDPLRDYFNYKYSWSRPDDVKGLDSNGLDQHVHLHSVEDIKANLDGKTDQKWKKDERVELIDQFIHQQITLRKINNRHELVECLKQLGNITRLSANYISLQHEGATDRLKGKFYGADFSFSDYQLKQKRALQNNIASEPQLMTYEECLKKRDECFKEMHRVRAKRADYNKKYYQPKQSKNRAIDHDLVNEDLYINSMIKMLIPSDQINHEDISQTYDLHKRDVEQTKQSQSLLSTSDGMSMSDEINGMFKLSEKFVPEPPSTSSPNLSEVELKAPKTDFGPNKAVEANNYSISKTPQIFWEIDQIQHSLNYQASKSMIGVKYERYTITSTEKSITSTAEHCDQRIEELGERTQRRNRSTQTGDCSTTELYQLTEAVRDATEARTRAYEERKLAFEQEVERYEFEVNRARQDHQTLSRRTQQRSFMERAHRIFRDTKVRVRNTLQDIIKSLISEAPRTGRDRWRFKTISERAEAIGVDRLVNIARQRTERRQRIENVQRFKQEIELIKQRSAKNRIQHTITDVLVEVGKSFTELDLTETKRLAGCAEVFLQDFTSSDTINDDPDLYLDGYEFHLERCVESLKQQLNNKVYIGSDLEVLKQFAMTVETHIDQIKSDTLSQSSLIFYQNAQLKVAKLVQDFRAHIVQDKTNVSVESVEQAQMMSQLDTGLKNVQKDHIDSTYIERDDGPNF